MEVKFIQPYVTEERVRFHMDGNTLAKILKDTTIVKTENMLVVVDGHHRLVAYLLERNINWDRLKEKILKKYKVAHVLKIDFQIPADIILYDSVSITESEEIFAKSFPFANYLFVSSLRKFGRKYIDKPVDTNDKIVVTGMDWCQYSDPYMGHIYLQNMQIYFQQYIRDEFYNVDTVLECISENMASAKTTKGYIYSDKPLVKYKGNVYWLVKE